MLTGVFAKTVRDRGLAILLVAVILVFLSGFSMAIYSGFDDGVLSFYDDMPEALTALYGVNDGTAAGIVTGAIFNVLGPILLLVAAISGASDAAIGEERRESIGLLLANPLSRRHLLLSKMAVMVIGVAVIAVMLWGGSLAVSELVGLDLAGRDVGAASVQMIGLAWMFGALALVIGAATGQRYGSGIAAFVAAISYLVTNLFPVEPDLEPYASWSPWYLYSGGEPLQNGIDWPGLMAMTAIAAALIVASVPLYDRRDIRG